MLILCVLINQFKKIWKNQDSEKKLSRTLKMNFYKCLLKNFFNRTTVVFENVFKGLSAFSEAEICRFFMLHYAWRTLYVKRFLKNDFKILEFYKNAKEKPFSPRYEPNLWWIYGKRHRTTMKNAGVDNLIGSHQSAPTSYETKLAACRATKQDTIKFEYKTDKSHCFKNLILCHRILGSITREILPSTCRGFRCFDVTPSSENVYASNSI